MQVFVVLYRSNCGDGTSTHLEEIFQCESDAEKFVEDCRKTLDDWAWLEIIEKEVL